MIEKVKETLEHAELSCWCPSTRCTVLSPFILAVFIDGIVDNVKSTNVSCYIGLSTTCYCIFLYADDILSIAPSMSGLQILLNACEEELSAIDVFINQCVFDLASALLSALMMPNPDSLGRLTPFSVKRSVVHPNRWFWVCFAAIVCLFHCTLSRRVVWVCITLVFSLNFFGLVHQKW